MDDGSANLWLIWHACTAILEKTSLFFSNNLFAPGGVSVKLDYPFLNSLIGLPAFVLGGPALAYNFIVLFSFVVSFWGFYLFTKSITNEKISGISGALIFTFCAYRLNVLGLGQLDLLSTEWLGFLLYFLFRIKGDRKDIANIFWFSFFTALTAYTDLRTFIFTLVFVSFIFIYKILFENSREVLKRFILSLTGIFILVFPLILLNKESLSLHPTPLEPDSPKLVSADMAGYLFPFQIASNEYYGLTIPFLGFVTIIFAIYYFAKKTKFTDVTKPLLFSALFMFLLSLGDGINILGSNYFSSEFMPFEIMKKIPILYFFRSPVRFSLGVLVPVAIFAALGIKEFAKDKRKSLSFVIFFALILQNFPFSPKTTFAKIDYGDKVLHRLSSLPSKNVLFVPFGTMDSYDQPHGNFDWEMLTTQVVHNKPIIGGYLSYIDPKILHKTLDNDFVERLIACEKKNECQKTDGGLFIKKFNVGYLLVKNNTPKNLSEFSTSSLSGKLLEKNENYSLYLLQ